VELLLLRRCSPDFGDLQEAVAFGRGACAQFGCKWGLQLETSAWGSDRQELPGHFISRHLWLGHVAGIHALHVQDVERLSAETRLQLQQYGQFMSKLQLRDVPDATCALLLPFDHAYTPYADMAGSSNKMWHPQPPSRTISTIIDMFFPGIAPAAQWQSSWASGVRPMADTRWGAVLDILVEEDAGSSQRLSKDAWGKYKYIIAPSLPLQQLQMQLDDVISAAEAGATIVLDAGIVLSSLGGSPSLFLTATGCDFGDLQARGGDVVVRAWVRKAGWGLRGVQQAPPVVVNEILLVRPCVVPVAAAAGGSRVEVMASSAGGSGTGRELPLLVRKWHGSSGGSVVTCMVPHMQAPAGLAGPCADAVALAGTAAAVVDVRSSGSEGLLLAYSSSVSSDGSRRSVVLNNNAAAWWTGDVRVEAAQHGKAWGECVLHEGSVSQQQQKLVFETGVDADACVHGVRVPPLGFIRISCAHVPDY
jgi:hypothetical protein